MSTFTIDQLIDYTEKWLVTGDLNAAILADDFCFISPFWESNDKNAFLAKFLDGLLSEVPAIVPKISPLTSSRHFV